LLISSSSNKADLHILLNACEDYMIQYDVATKIISEVIAAMNDRKVLATQLDIAKREMNMFENVFASRIANKTQ